jgi:hypothetical protein
MAPPRKKKRAPGEGHPLHVKLPQDVMKLVEAKATKEQWTLNRTVINLLASIPHLEKVRTAEQVLHDMQIVLARYGSRQTADELSEPILRAIDEVLSAKADGELQTRLDRLRVLRADMRKHERTAKE